MMTPVKYESDSKNLPDIFPKSKISFTENLTRGPSVSPAQVIAICHCKITSTYLASLSARITLVSIGTSLGTTIIRPTVAGSRTALLSRNAGYALTGRLQYPTSCGDSIATHDATERSAAQCVLTNYHIFRQRQMMLFFSHDFFWI